MIQSFPTGATRAVVLLHGRGSNARQIFGLLAYAGLDKLAAVAPEAPGNSWWPTSFLAPEAQIGPPLSAAMGMVDGAVDALVAQGFQRADIWLAGFSQGAVLALEYLARKGDGLAGAFGFSGGLIGQGDVGGGRTDLYGFSDKSFDYPLGARGKVWISVHEQDPHIPLKRAKDSARIFEGLGAEVRFQTYPGRGHQIMTPDIDVMREWLA